MQAIPTIGYYDWVEISECVRVRVVWYQLQFLGILVACERRKKIVDSLYESCFFLSIGKNIGSGTVDGREIPLLSSKVRTKKTVSIYLHLDLTVCGVIFIYKTPNRDQWAIYRCNYTFINSLKEGEKVTLMRFFSKHASNIQSHH